VVTTQYHPRRPCSQRLHPSPRPAHDRIDWLGATTASFGIASSSWARRWRRTSCIAGVRHTTASSARGPATTASAVARRDTRTGGTGNDVFTFIAGDSSPRPRHDHRLRRGDKWTCRDRRETTSRRRPEVAFVVPPPGPAVRASITRAGGANLRRWRNTDADASDRVECSSRAISPAQPRICSLDLIAPTLAAPSLPRHGRVEPGHDESVADEPSDRACDLLRRRTSAVGSSSGTGSRFVSAYTASRVDLDAQNLGS
jgi:hypothetical protein